MTDTNQAGAGALRAVAARSQANRRRLIVTGCCALLLASLALVGALAPGSTDAAQRDWLSFVTLPAALLLLWVGGRFAVFALHHAALRRDRRDIERQATLRAFADARDHL